MQWYDLQACTNNRFHKLLLVKFFFSVVDNNVTGMFRYDKPNNNLLINSNTYFNSQSFLFYGIVVENTYCELIDSPYFKIDSSGNFNKLYVYLYIPTPGYYLESVDIKITPIKDDKIPKQPLYNPSPPAFTPSSDPYSTQKIIQNTVRVAGSLYVENLGALTIYQPDNWNNQSDRTLPHTQRSSTSGNNSTKGTITRCRPNACAPGGTGVDIKHGSYARYLGKLKGKKDYKAQPIPPWFGKPEIYINPAFPFYGNKLVKTNIVAGYNSACGRGQCGRRFKALVE